MSREYLESVRQFKVDKGSVTLWWLGQMGYLVKTPGGAVLSVDAYLTNSCGKIGESLGLDMNRRVPVFIEPEELEIDHFLCTHSHYDHADPETITRLPKHAIQTFVGPGLACESFVRCGVEEAKIQEVYAGAKRQISDVVIHGTFAMPTDDSDLNHIGFLLAVEDGPRIYITGDTDYSDLLACVRKLEPQVMIACINGGFNNMSAWEAAELAAMVKPKVAIPCHYDMFPDNAADPRQFHACLRARAPEVRYVQLEYVKPFVFKS
jgi:L-ascorbate 6-phosphate lactonase